MPPRRLAAGRAPPERRLRRRDRRPRCVARRRQGRAGRRARRQRRRQVDAHARSRGFIRPDQRRACCSSAGASIAPRRPHRRATGWSLVPEGRQVFPELSVIDNLRLGAYARGSRRRERQDRRAARPLRRAQGAAHQRAGLLSGRRAADAGDRPRADRPSRVLMLDEPSLGLAPKTSRESLRSAGRAARRRDDDLARRPEWRLWRCRSPIAPTCCSSGSIKKSGTADEIARTRRWCTPIWAAAWWSHKTQMRSQFRQEGPIWTSFSGTPGKSGPSTN